MNFGGWFPLQDAATVAPNKPGVLQVRADALTRYPKGNSAMVWYACTSPNQALRGYVAGKGAPGMGRAAALGGRWIRFGESAAPALDRARLLRQFAARFGASPTANNDSEQHDSDNTSDDDQNHDQDDDQEARSFDG